MSSRNRYKKIDAYAVAIEAGVANRKELSFIWDIFFKIISNQGELKRTKTIKNSC